MIAPWSERFPTGVGQIDRWSVKAWWSVTQRRWLIQVEHDLPERGGWIRAWLVSADTGLPLAFASLAEAEVVMSQFLADPDWSLCGEFASVI